MAGPVLPHNLPPLDDTMGALYIGVLVSALLYGVSFLQTVYYYFACRNDWIGLKLLVGVLCVLDTIHQAMITHAAYIYMVTNFMNPRILATVVWTLIAEVLVNALLAFCVQGFFVWRIHVLSRMGLWLSAPLALMSMARLAMIASWVGKSAHLKTWDELMLLENLSRSATVITLVADGSIAATLILLLCKSRPSSRNSYGLDLIKYTLNTGVLTSLDTLCLVIAYISNPESLIPITFFFVLGRLYSNSLLATLNARGVPSSLERMAFGMHPRSSSSFVLSDVTADYKISYVETRRYTERSAQEYWDNELGMVSD